MSSDHEAEIRASVAAHADLGPVYDDAVAEGLVERIGAEIDKRIDARLGQFGATGAPGPACGISRARRAGSWASGARGAGRRPTRGPPAGRRPAGQHGAGHHAGPARESHPPPAGYPGYQGYPGYLGPVLPPGYQLGPPPARPSEVGARNVATTIIALGSMALGVVATAVVSHAADLGGQGFIILLIWAAIAVVNIAHARRP